MSDDTCKNEDTEHREGEEEEVEVLVVPLPHTVAHPGAVVVETF